MPWFAPNLRHLPPAAARERWGDSELAGLGEVLPLLQLHSPSDVASQQCSAVGIRAIGEVLAGQADSEALSSPQAPFH